MMLDLIINLAGTTFLSDDVKDDLRKGAIKVDDLVTVKQMNSTDRDYDADFAVVAGDKHIGWIPQLNTIKKYIVKELDENNRQKHDMQVRRHRITEMVRGMIVTELHINDCDAVGKITNILETDNGYSISVLFN